jgi:peptidyl-dipeptidase Dcp
MAVAGLVAACSANNPATAPAEAEAAGGELADNPLLAANELPYGLPPFDRIEDEHFAPALEQVMRAHRAEVERIARQQEAPTVENTLVALERAGVELDRLRAAFWARAATDATEALEATRRDMAPRLSAHDDAIMLDAELFARIELLHDGREELEVDAETRRLIERYHEDFVRAGARLSSEGKERLRTINAELASLETTFTQHALQEVNDSAVVIEEVEELAGLPAAEIRAAAELAAERGLEGAFVLTLVNTTEQPVLARLENRDLRERIYRASVSRGGRGGDFDNREILRRVIQLRAERARLLGYPHHAAYVLEEQTAQDVETVVEMHAQLIPAAVDRARAEAEELQQLIASTGGDFELRAWDWAYYAEKLRRHRYAFDESMLRDYLELDRVLARGVFFMAERLYGLTFEERDDLPIYHPDVRTFEVFDHDGEPLGLMLADLYARPSKRGGAWMNAYVTQAHLLDTRAVVGIHLNVPKPPEGEPTLLSWNEVRVLFHECGHALHGLLSDVTYPLFSGTAVPRDFVEYPSQVHEMWADWPEVLENYAAHHETGEPMPPDLLERLRRAERFNDGFRTTEYLAASALDLAWHQLAEDEVPAADEIDDFEAAALEAAGAALDVIAPRYRSTYFMHILGGYAAAYYAYVWSEVLDADTVEWFIERGGLTRENGDHFRKTLLSRGGSADAMELYRAFRGRAPRFEPLLERRGFSNPAER